MNNTVLEFQMESKFRRTRIIRQSDGVYWLGLIGAFVYYIQQAATFGAGVMGVLKAIVWPAMLVYELLKYLKM